MRCAINFTYLSIYIAQTCNYMNHHSCTHTHTHTNTYWWYQLTLFNRKLAGNWNRSRCRCRGQNYQQIVDRFHLICALNCSATRFVRVINVQITFWPTDWRTDVAAWDGRLRGRREGVAADGDGNLKGALMYCVNQRTRLDLHLNHWRTCRVTTQRRQ